MGTLKTAVFVRQSALCALSNALPHVILNYRKKTKRSLKKQLLVILQQRRRRARKMKKLLRRKRQRRRQRWRRQARAKRLSQSAVRLALQPPIQIQSNALLNAALRRQLVCSNGR